MSTPSEVLAVDTQPWFTRMVRGVVWAQLGKLLETMLILVFTVVVVRKLGPQAYGQYALVSNTIVIALLLTSVGAQEILGNYVPKLLSTGNRAAAGQLVFRVVTLRLSLVLLSVIVLYALRQVLATVFRTADFVEAAGWISLLLIAVAMGEIMLTLLTALLDVRYVALVRALGLLLTTVAAISWFFWRTPSVAGVVVATMLGWMLVIGFAARRLWGHLHTWYGGAISTPPVARYGMTIWATNLLGFGLSSYSSVFFLGLLASDTSQMGFYNAAVLPVSRIWTAMVAGLIAIMLPTFAEISARYGTSGLARAWGTFVSLLALLLIPAYGFLLVFAFPIVQLVYGSQFLPAAGLMQLYLGVSLLASLLGGSATVTTFYTSGRQSLVLLTSAIGGALNIGLLLLLIPRFEALGAIVADGVANIVTGAIYIGLLKHQLGVLRYPFALIIKFGGAVFGSAFVASVVVPPRDVVTLVLSLVLGGAGCIGICWLIKPLAGAELPVSRFGPRLGKVIRLFDKASTGS